MNSVNEQLKAIDKELADLESRKQVLIERKASLEKTRRLFVSADSVIGLRFSLFFMLF